MRTSGLFLVSFFLCFGLYAQGKEYKGVVEDQFKNRLQGVVITNLRTGASFMTDCQGRFKILVEKGDSISIYKKYLIRYSKEVNKYERTITLPYDVALIKSDILKHEEERRKQNPDAEFCRCQPIFLVDGQFFNPSEPMHVEESSVKMVKVFKGKEANYLFGEYASSGAVFVITHCGAQGSQP